MSSLRAARLRLAQLACTASVATVTACGGSDNPLAPDGDSGRLSVAEAQIVAIALFTEVSRVLSSVSFVRADAVAVRDGDDALRPRRAAGALRASLVAPAALRGPLAVATLETTQFDERCSGGGRMTGSVTVTDDIDQNGSGTLAGTMNFVPRGCMVSIGRETLAIEGNPSLTYSFSQTFSRGVGFTDYVWRASGGFRWKGGSCAIDYSARVDAQGRGTLTGSVCGQRIDDTF